MASALGDLELVRRHLDSDPACIRTRVSDTYFPKQNPQSRGTIYIYQSGRGRTPHQVARDFGHEKVFQLLMRHSPEEAKFELACDVGDEEMFRAFLASRPNWIATLSDADRRRLTDAAENNNTDAVRLMLAAGWPVDTKRRIWHESAAMGGVTGQCGDGQGDSALSFPARTS
jgi:hypothetical protein